MCLLTHKMKRGTLISVTDRMGAEWKPMESNRSAKYYSLTRLGRKHLEKEAANLDRLSAAVSHVLRLGEA